MKKNFYLLGFVGADYEDENFFIEQTFQGIEDCIFFHSLAGVRYIENLEDLKECLSQFEYFRAYYEKGHLYFDLVGHDNTIVAELRQINKRGHERLIYREYGLSEEDFILDNIETWYKYYTKIYRI